MKKLRKIIACALALSMTAGLCACEDEPESTPSAPVTTPATTTATTADPDADAATDKDAKEIDTTAYTPDGNAGTITYLGIYDITTDQKGDEQTLVFESDTYGGKIEVIQTASGQAYYDKLATMISSATSPDIVYNDGLAFPGLMSKNTYEPLDEYFDMDSPLWVDMKELIQGYTYNGKHYFYPHRIVTTFALNYNRKTIEENNLPDPYQLYKSGEWTWDAWRSMMIDFCNKDEENIGFYATDTIVDAFVLTAGDPIVDVQGDGTIINNIMSPNVSRAMEFLSTLYRDGVMYAKQLGDWVPPQTFATSSDRLLFLGMEPEWTYIAATEEIQNPTGVENDIHDTVSDFAFVPYPRDPSSDTYYQGYDTFGYLVPKGADNIKGAIDWIYCNRVYEVDENIAAQIREDHINPEPETYTEGKYAGQRKWHITWDADVYDLWREMCDPANFTYVHEDMYGFNTDLNTQLAVLYNVAFDGESWAQKSAELQPILEGTIEEFR